jgi:hypothetical protein
VASTSVVADLSNQELQELGLAGATLDLPVVRGGLRLGFEFKRTTAPRVTPPTNSRTPTDRLNHH